MNINDELLSREEEHFDYILKWALTDALEQEGLGLLAEQGEEDSQPVSQRLTKRIHKIVRKARRRQNKLDKKPMPVYLKRAIVGVLALALVGSIVTGGANAFLTSIRNVWQEAGENVSKIILGGRLPDGTNVTVDIYTGDVPAGMIEDMDARKVIQGMKYTKFSSATDWFTFREVKREGTGGANDLDAADENQESLVIGSYQGQLSTDEEGVTKLLWYSDTYYWKLTSTLDRETLKEMARSVVY